MALATELFGRTFKKGEKIFRQGDPGAEMYIIQSGAVEVSKMRRGRKVVLALLEKNDFFGEVALIDSKPRSATVTAITRTRLLPLSRNTFIERIPYNPDVVLRVLRALSRRIDRMTNTIRSLIGRDEELRQKIFIRGNDLQDNHLLHADTVVQTDGMSRELSQPAGDNHPQASSKDFSAALKFDSKKPVFFLQDQIIFEHGDAGHHMYLILRGAVEVFQAAQNGDDYRIALLGPGDFFGEMALITGGRRTASAKANTPVELLPLNQEDMLNGIRSDPETGLFFLHVLINRLRAITDALEQPEKSLQTLRQAVIPVIKRTEIVSMGISSLSSCGGCAAVFVRDPQELSWITQNVDVSYCPMLMDQEEIKDVIFAVVDGAVRTRENEEKLIEVRRKSRFLIALGTCAVFGGIPALANSYDLEELISESYGRTTDPFLYYLADNGFEHETATPYLEAHLLRKVRNVSDVVRVDYFLPGCPPVLGLLIDLLKELQGEHLPGVNRQIVCKECTRKHRRSSLDSLRVFPTTADKKELCFLSSGVMCMGLLTRGGCRAACPGGGLPCWGCRGPSNSVIAKINRGETFEEVMLWSLARRLKKDASKIKPVLKILRLKGGSALNFDQNFIKDVSKIR